MLRPVADVFENIFLGIEHEVLRKITDDEFAPAGSTFAGIARKYAPNLRLTVLRSLFKKARRHGIVQWELDVASVAQELVHDVRGPGDELLNKMLTAAKALMVSTKRWITRRPVCRRKKPAPPSAPSWRIIKE